MASGSETRERDISLGARFNEAEAAHVREAADRRGVTVASLIRMTLLDEPKARATRRPPVNAALVARLILALGPIADSLRQIAAQPLAAPDPRLGAALDQLADMSFLCLQAMGRGRARRLGSALPPAAFPEPLCAVWERAARETRPVPLPLLAFAAAAPS